VDNKFLDDADLADFTARVDAMQRAELDIRIMRDGATSFITDLSKKYGVPPSFKVNQRTGQIILPDNVEKVEVTTVETEELKADAETVEEPGNNGLQPKAKKKSGSRKKA